MDKIFDVAILGAGPVGLFSIFSCGMQGLSCVIVDRLPILGGQCAFLYGNKNIYDIPGVLAITGQELVDNLVKQMQKFQPEIILNSFVKYIQKNEQFFTIQMESQIIKAKSVIIAFGEGAFLPIKPEISNLAEFEEKNVFYAFDKNLDITHKTIAIAGAGNSAFDILQEAQMVKKIYLIHRRDYLKAYNSSIKNLEKLIEEGKVEVLIPNVVNSVNSSNEKLKLGVKNLNDNEIKSIEVDYFFPCFGVKADNNFLKDWHMELFENKIIVEATTMATSIEGIYAVGDCVYYKNKQKLIAIGFAESFQMAQDLAKYLLK